MITEKEKKIKDALTITIMIITLLLLIVWWIVNAVFQNSIVMLTSVALAGNITSMAFSLLVISVLAYCRCLLNKAKAVQVNKYGNDKILFVLLWLNVLTLIN